jgi:hypothetical protein
MRNVQSQFTSFSRQRYEPALESARFPNSTAELHRGSGLTYDAFFLAAHRAFIIADSFFLIAGLIGLRPAAFFWAGAAFFGAAAPFRFAQRCFIAALILARAAALKRRRFRPIAGVGWLALGGRPRRAGWEPVPTRAAIACSIRLASCLSCSTIPSMSMLSFRF